MKKYMVHIPGGYPNGPFYASNEREARTQIRQWLNVNKLPNGTEIYLA